jgi:hypothetical protein
VDVDQVGDDPAILSLLKRGRAAREQLTAIGDRTQ